MHEKILEVQESLYELEKGLSELQFPNDDLHSWSPQIFPCFNAGELVYLPYDLSNKINLLENFEPDKNDLVTLNFVLATLSKVRANITNLAVANPTQAADYISNFLLTMLYVGSQINELFSFEVLKDRKLLPKNIQRRLEGFDDNIDKLNSDFQGIDNKISVINDAYDTADGLPTTLKELKETKTEVANILNESKANLNELEGISNESLKMFNAISETSKSMTDKSAELEKTIKEYMSAYKKEAQAYIDKCEEAFRTTTSKGLAGAFQEKADKLNKSIRLWVVGLMSALGTGALVGYFRLQVLQQYIISADGSTIKLLIQLFLSILSVGAPLWFAWLATKQIGQRFRLAEDYEFKSSVSKAYEGYRREAVNLDKSFATRLFGNALTRLEEPPLRFIEENTHSSPVMELLSSDIFKDFVSKGGESVDRLLLKAGLQRKAIEPVAKAKKINETKVAEEVPEPE
ncbi:MAG: hypothetical protein G3W58_18040 [Pantoea ananatis]|nr:hypothetical protein [Pantoea ananatis]